MMPHAEAVVRSVSVVLTEVFFAGLWQGMVTTLAVAAMLRAFPRAGAGARYAALRVAFVLLAVLPWVHLPHAVVPRAGAGHAVEIMPLVATAIAAIWVVLSTVRAVQLLLGYRHLRAVWRRAVPLETGERDLPSLVSGGRPMVLCTSADVDSPTVLGFMRPRFLLPEWLAPTLTKTDLEQIALHECEHLRRHDDWMNLMQQVAQIVFPLQPALLWLNLRLEVQRELACDAGVIARTAEPIVYASCLTRLAEQRLEHRSRMRLALAAWERRSELASRVHALLDQTVTSLPAQSRFAAIAMTLVFVTGALTMAGAPQFVQVRGGDAAGAEVATAGRGSAVSRDLPRSASMVPVEYRSAHDAFATASFREPSVAREVKSSAVLPVRAVRRRRAGVRPGLLQTALPSRPAPDRGAHLVRVEFTHSYAAVPFGDGWLLIQL